MRDNDFFFTDEYTASEALGLKRLEMPRAAFVLCSRYYFHRSVYFDLREEGWLGSQMRLLRALSGQIFKTSMDKDCTDSGQPISLSSWSRKFLLASSLNFSCFNLCPLSLIIPTHITVCYLAPSPQALGNAVGLSQSQLFSRLSKFRFLSLSLLGKCPSHGGPHTFIRRGELNNRDLAGGEGKGMLQGRLR